MSEKPPLNGRNDDSDELRDLWQGQNLERERMRLDEIRRRAAEFERTIRHRNIGEYVAAAVVVMAFSVIASLSSDIWVRVGAGLIVAAALYVVPVLYTHGSAQPIPDDEARLTLIRFHRLSLERAIATSCETFGAGIFYPLFPEPVC